MSSERSSGDAKSGPADDSGFKSLIAHPEANDGLDGVNLRNRKASLDVDDEVSGVVSRLLEKLKLIERDVKESKDLAHLGKLARGLDEVLSSAGIQSKKFKVVARSCVDGKRILHVNGSELVFFCDTRAGGISAVVGAPVERMLINRLAKRGSSEVELKDLLASSKQIVRKGFHPKNRPKVWRTLVMGDGFNETSKEKEFDMLADEMWHGHIPDYEELEHHVHVPDFGGPHSLFHSHPITEQGEAVVERLLCILQHTHPDVVYCPFLPDLCSILCLHMPEWEVYHVVDRIIQRSKRDEWYLPVTGERFMCYIESFLTLLQARLHALHKHIKKLGINFEVEVEVWFARLFVSFLPYDLVLRIMDCFLSEGAKMLFRVGLALLRIHEKELLSCNSKQTFLVRLAKLLRTQTPAELLLEKAFNIRAFSRKMLAKLHATHEIKEIPFAKVPVFYVPQFTAKMSKLLTVTMLRRLWKHLPALMRIQDPVMLFTTEEHGYNLDILLDRTGHQSAFIVLKSADGSVFGVFLHWREGLARHEIGEESFVFTLAPKISVFHYFYRDPTRWGDAKAGAISEGITAAPLRRSESDPVGTAADDSQLPRRSPVLRGAQSEFATAGSTGGSFQKKQRTKSEKEPASKSSERDSVRAARAQTNSAPNSPMRRSTAPKLAKNVSEEMRFQFELKQTKPRDLGRWRSRKRAEEERMTGITRQYVLWWQHNAAFFFSFYSCFVFLN